MAAKKKELSELQKRFVAEYLVDLNATQAYLRAGYKVKNERVAQANSSVLLSNPMVQEAVARGRQRQEKRTEVTADRVLLELARIGFADIRTAFGDNGELVPVKQMPEETAAFVSSVEVFEEHEGTGAARRVIGHTKKLRFWDKIAALEKIGRHLGMFGEDQWRQQMDRLWALANQAVGNNAQASSNDGNGPAGTGVEAPVGDRGAEPEQPVPQ